MKTEDLLRAVQEGSCTVEDAMEQLKTLPYENMGYARLDHHRALRTGFPEVIFSQGKTVAHMAEIFQHLYQRSGTVLATRTSGEQYQAVRALVPQAEYNEMARTVTVGMKPESERPGLIAVCTGGTADIPVAEEAAVTAEMCGARVLRVYDIGVSARHSRAGAWGAVFSVQCRAFSRENARRAGQNKRKSSTQAKRQHRGCRRSFRRNRRGGGSKNQNSISPPGRRTDRAWATPGNGAR